MTKAEAAEILGVSPRSIDRILKRAGITGRPGKSAYGRPPTIYDPKDIERVRLARLREAEAAVEKLKR